MKIIYAGSSEFAISPLEELKARRLHTIALVISQPARPKGRKLIPEDTPLALAAREMGLELYTPEDINSSEAIARIAAEDADIIITASYGAFLGKSLRVLCRFGAINLHPSLLPRHRGASPIRSALLSGDKLTGNSIFRLVKKMDAGPILMQEKLEIAEHEDYGSLHARLANQAAMMLPRLLDTIESAVATPQNESEATYSRMIHKDDLRLDFALPAITLQNMIRAYAPEPGAFTVFRGKELKILEAEILDSNPDQPPGSICQIIKNIGFSVASADAELMIRKVQAAGKKAMTAWAYSLGARFEPGERIDQ
ncbi:MAG: methionyl-tRNA formyltransferase [Candidatus Cloacimonetes bacterium]|nr:methionyl-tRNA formyltransferase [Candidatus Cloacimonadota bacterium]